MAFNISVQVQGIDEIIHWADALPGVTQRQALTILERWGRDMVQLGERLSPRDKLRGQDPRRRPEREAFAFQWQHNVRATDDGGAVLDVGNVDKRMGFIIHDTPPRAIPRSVTEQLAKGYPMRFVWRGAWHTAWKISGGVAAHGTKGRPVHEWILDEFDIGSHLHDITSGIR